MWSKGRSLANEKVTGVARYVPRPRVPWQPSQFHRQNMTKEDMTKMWGRGRYRTGYGNYNSGYYTEKTHTLEDKAISMIPKHELEKFMPDISLGPKALVTPVSLMSARGGHRVTHDMLHSYDAHVGSYEKAAVVDHDNITPQDHAFVGLNAAALDCQGRIYRWLRRGPFFQEDQYFRRYVQNGGASAAQDAPLFAKIIRLAKQGHLKAACESYRSITSVPPVEVYRALTEACIHGGHLGDAVSTFEDGHAKLFYVARDGEVVMNLMRVAIAANNRPRVMWVYNLMRGRFYENQFVRAEIDPLWQYRITTLALSYLLDHHAAEEAKVLYQYLREAQLLDSDLQIRRGQQMQAALAEGKPVTMDDALLKETSLMQAAEQIAVLVAEAVREQHMPHEASLHRLSDKREKDVLSVGSAAVNWLQEKYLDLDVLCVLRLARFMGTRDLMANEQQAFVERASSWLSLLSNSAEQMDAVPLTYLRKSKKSAVNDLVRIGWAPEDTLNTRLLPSEDQFSFYYHKDARFVRESYPPAGDSIASRYLAMQPVHTEVTSMMEFSTSASPSSVMLEQQAEPARLLHSSVLRKDVKGPTSSSGDAAGNAASLKIGSATVQAADVRFE